jgi:tetratricopeptide (TPR) repeat protein
MDKLQFAQAVPLLDAAARLSGGAAEDEYHLALALQRQGDVTSAQRHIRQALAKKDAGDFHRLAGELEEQLGNPLAAVQEEQRATQMDPSEVNYFTWGSELLRHRAIWQAAEVFANGVKAHPASVRVRTAWGAALFAGARYDEAAQKICEASGLDPSVREPYLFAGKIALASPQVPSCVAQTLQRFLALRPDDAEANYLSAMLLLRQGGKPEQAEPLLRKAVALDPKCSDGYLQLGIMSAARKDYAGAIAEYMKSLEGDHPQKGEAHYRLAVAYDRTGQPEKAKAEYRLHEQMDAADAALVERERREVKQFSIVTSGSPGTP